jgi:arylsulfatase A-like enzyme
MLHKMSRAVVAGLCGGVFSGCIDFARAWSRLGTFLPSGRWKLLFFLCSLYAALATLLALALYLLHAVLVRSSDLGALERAAFAQEPSDGSSRRAYLIAVLVGLGVHGWLVHGIALECLKRFHHRGLLTGLVGAGAAALAVPLAVWVLLAARGLSLVLRDKRVRLEFAAPVAVETVGWLVGLGAAAASISFLLLQLLQRPRMGAPLQATNVAMWAPVLLVGGVAIGHGLGRLGRRLRALWLSTPAGVALSAAASLGAVLLLFVVGQYAAVRQLDMRPWIATAALVVATTSFALSRFAPQPPRALVIAPLVCVALVLSLGKSDRVRKAAVSFSGLTAPVVQLVHAASDLDGDHYSSLLGGGDCNDFDRNVHPGAFDWPDDGIDQDCNGHQASLSERPPRTDAEIPDGVPKQPNVLLITIDALRSDHVGAYGYRRPTTPNLDALAKDSVLFENSWAHAPSTRYSVPAILTGRYPSTIAVGNSNWPPNVLPENRLIAEILKEQGYHTGAILSYHYFNRNWGLDQGFDDYDISLQTLHSMGGDPARTQGTSAKQMADLDIQYLQRHKGEKFFLWSHFYDTHFMFERHPDLPESNFGDDEPALYDGEIRFTDFHIGRVLEALKREGLWDNTIIIVTSDHGDGFGEHGLPASQRHGYHLYRNETAVPLIVRVPGLAPRRVQDLAGHVDILPTLLNLLRVAPTSEPQLLGDSVVDLMLGKSRSRRVFQEVWYEGPTSRKAVVDRNWHLIRNLVPDDTAELYAQSDIGEEHDRAGEGEAAEVELGQALAAWMDDIAIPADFRKRVEGNISKEPIAFRAPLGDRLGDWLELAGSDPPEAAHPGQTFELNLVLVGKSQVPDGWRFFTHVIAPNGQRMNADHEPVENLFPLPRITPGTWVRDRVRIALPASWPIGQTRVEVGLWQRNQRAQVSGPHAQKDSVLAATIAVTQ